VLAVDEGHYRLGPAGVTVLTSFGLDMSAIARARRSFGHPCLDWSERRHHVAGALGAALLIRMTDLGWMSPHPASRAVRLHETGRRGLSEVFGCELPSESQTAAAHHAASRQPPPAERTKNGKSVIGTGSQPASGQAP
jgi:hypothetical protein